MNIRQFVDTLIKSYQPDIAFVWLNYRKLVLVCQEHHHSRVHIYIDLHPDSDET